MPFEDLQSNQRTGKSNYLFWSDCKKFFGDPLKTPTNPWVYWLSNEHFCQIEYLASDTVWQKKQNICLASLRSWPQNQCQFPPCKNLQGFDQLGWRGSLGWSMYCMLGCTLNLHLGIAGMHKRAFSQPGCSLFVTDRGQRVTGAPWGRPASIYICARIWCAVRSLLVQWNVSKYNTHRFEWCLFARVERNFLYRFQHCLGQCNVFAA